MLYTLRFFPSKCSLFHNANLFVSYIIHILYTGCAEIKKNNYGAKGLNFTQLHFTTLAFGLTPSKFPAAPFHLTSLHFTSLHFTALLDDFRHTSIPFISPRL